MSATTSALQEFGKQKWNDIALERTWQQGSAKNQTIEVGDMNAVVERESTQKDPIDIITEESRHIS